jgi:hypothetical protein
MSDELLTSRGAVVHIGEVNDVGSEELGKSFLTQGWHLDPLLLVV